DTGEELPEAYPLAEPVEEGEEGYDTAVEVQPASEEDVSQANQTLDKFQQGQAQPEEGIQLATQLSNLDNQQLQQVAADRNLQAPPEIRDQLVTAIKERLTAQGAEAPAPGNQPQQPRTPQQWAEKNET